MFYRLSKLNYAWRVIATGICFATFMLGALVVAASPLVHLVSASPEIKSRRTRRLIQHLFVFFIKYMTFLGVISRPKIEGLNHVDNVGPCLVIANHPTLLDVVLLMSVIPDCNCVVKRSL